jgi:hypothetical protein
MEAVGCFELWRKKQAAESPCRRRLPPGLSGVKGRVIRESCSLYQNMDVDKRTATAHSGICS